MSQKIVLHIGTEKTGSTTIQNTLGAHRSKLMDRNISYFGPVSIRSILFSALRKSAGNPTCLNGLKLAVKRSQTTILSNELLQSRLKSSEQLLALKETLLQLEPSSIQVILYLRRQAEIGNSMISTAAKVNQDKKQSLLSDYMRTICNHQQTLMLWSSIFGRTNITPRLFDRNRFTKGDLMKDFLETINLPFHEVSSVDTKNESLSWDGVLIARTIHAKLETQFPTMKPNQRNQLGAKICNAMVTPIYSCPKLCLPPIIWKIIDEEYADVNEWTRTEWFSHLSIPSNNLFSGALPSKATSPTLAKQDISHIASDAIRQYFSLEEESSQTTGH
jgi:hypothetical protein